MSERMKAAFQKQDPKRQEGGHRGLQPRVGQLSTHAYGNPLYLHRVIGNQAVLSLSGSGIIQEKLVIGGPDDIYEQEADRVADEVMRMSDPMIQPKPPSITPLIQRQELEEEEEEPLQMVRRQTEEEEEEKEFIQPKLISEQITPLVQRRGEEEEEKETVQRKLISPGQLFAQRQEEPEEEEVQAKLLPGNTGPLLLRQVGEEEEEEEETVQAKAFSRQIGKPSPDFESRINRLEGGGEPLPKSVRTFFEPRFGHDFSQVRVHANVEAANMAQSVNARAFTVGSDVVFGAGRFAPKAPEGQKLLAHELSHVVQQGGVRVGRRALQCAPEQPPVPLEEAEAKRIPPADRHAIELAATGYISLAFTAFSNATAAHAAAIKNEAKAKAEMLAAVVDVVTGFLAPIFANWVAGKLIAKAASAQVGQVTKTVAVKLITRQDLFKAAFIGATKIANQVMKSKSNALFGETEIDSFALALRNTFQRGAAAVLDRLTTMKQKELLAVWTAYDPDNADESAYRNVLAGLFKRYQKQVEPIGTKSWPSPEGGPSASSSVYEVQLANRKRLATITVWSSGENNLWAWVTPDMETIARAKATALGLGVPTIALKDVHVALAEILDPPRPDLRQKDMLEVARALGPAERQRAAANPDVVTVIETGREISGRIPNQYERHKTLFVLRGFSSAAIACLDELDSLLPNWWVIQQKLQSADAAERGLLAKDPWFVGRLHAELRGYGLEQVLFTLGLGPEPLPEPAYHPPILHGR
jgi:hypothetical protein